jgi:hypothetical protein
MAAADIAALKNAADVISNRAKIIAGAFSRRIPAATHVAVSNGMVAVITDGTLAPNAAPFEAAELHPLWAHIGSWRYVHYKWGKQPPRPYMTEAAVQELDKAAEAYGQSIYAYAIAHGFKPA